MYGSELGTIDYFVYVEQIAPQGSVKPTMYTTYPVYAPGVQGQPLGTGSANDRAMALAHAMAARPSVLHVHVHAVEHVDVDLIK